MEKSSTNNSNTDYSSNEERKPSENYDDSQKIYDSLISDQSIEVKHSHNIKTMAPSLNSLEKMIDENFRILTGELCSLKGKIGGLESENINLKGEIGEMKLEITELKLENVSLNKNFAKIKKISWSVIS